jgi:hypothetical protein
MSATTRDDEERREEEDSHVERTTAKRDPSFGRGRMDPNAWWPSGLLHMLRGAFVIAISVLIACEPRLAENNDKKAVPRDAETVYHHVTFHPEQVELMAFACAFDMSLAVLAKHDSAEGACAACASSRSVDDWHTEIRVECFDGGTGLVTSAGPDRRFGTADDSSAAIAPGVSDGGSIAQRTE